MREEREKLGTQCPGSRDIWVVLSTARSGLSYFQYFPHRYAVLFPPCQPTSQDSKLTLGVATLVAKRLETEKPDGELQGVV